MEKFSGKNKRAAFNSYLGMAENDYLFAKGGMETCRSIGIFNSVASTAAQSCEKYLKAILNEKFLDDSSVIPLLKSHNLRSIFHTICEKYPDWDVSSMEIKWLGDFYFDARYPGDDFFCVEEEDAEKCIEILECVRDQARQILAAKEILQDWEVEELKDLLD